MSGGGCSECSDVALHGGNAASGRKADGEYQIEGLSGLVLDR